MMAQAIARFLEEIARDPPEDADGRRELYYAAERLMYSVEPTLETGHRLYYGHLPLAMAQVGLDLKLFDIITTSPGKHWTVDELAKETSADPVLLYRVVRTLASYFMVHQNEDGTFSASNVTHNLTDPSNRVGITFFWRTNTKALNAIPTCLANEKYTNPSSHTNTPFKLAYNTDLPPFEWRKLHPDHAKSAQAFMAARRMTMRSVFDGLVPLDDIKLSEIDLEQRRVLLVDVGGGYGHQCIDIRKKTGVKGHMITQDLSFVRQLGTNADELEALDIEPVAHDFMHPQPIQGAKVYYLRNVLHDWPDAPAEVILTQIKKAMAPDSVIILDDVVMPEVGATWKQTGMDMLMMSMLGAMERSRTQWRTLLAKVGLKIRDIWTYDHEFGDSIVVAVPDDEANGDKVNGVH